MGNCFIFVFLLAAPVCLEQSATINWVDQHQVIDGFGANDVNMNINPQLTMAQQTFFIGTGAVQLGLSVLRVGITNGGQEPGNCLTVSVSCEGYAATDFRAAAAYGIRVIATPFSPPAAYTTNGSTACTANGGNGQVAPAHYQDFANWIVNFSKSVQRYGGTSLYELFSA